jgi:hypothetical protein
VDQSPEAGSATFQGKNFMVKKQTNTAESVTSEHFDFPMIQVVPRLIASGELLLHLYVREVTNKTFSKENAVLLEAAAASAGLTTRDLVDDCATGDRC